MSVSDAHELTYGQFAPKVLGSHCVFWCSQRDHGACLCEVWQSATSHKPSTCTGTCASWSVAAMPSLFACGPVWDYSSVFVRTHFHHGYVNERKAAPLAFVAFASCLSVLLQFIFSLFSHFCTLNLYSATLKVYFCNYFESRLVYFEYFCTLNVYFCTSNVYFCTFEIIFLYFESIFCTLKVYFVLSKYV